MRNKTIILAGLAFLAVATQVSTAIAQGTAFTYQGRLASGTNLAHGSYDFTFTLYDSLTDGTEQGSVITNLAVGVTNGRFVVTLDFGDQFPGADRWLEIGVATNGGANFTTLAPRQPLTPTPYSIFAGNANSLAGSLPATQLVGPIDNDNLPPSPVITGTVTADGFVGDGSQVTGVDAAALDGLTGANFWQVGGNVGANPTNGAYLGTVDNMPLEIRVGGGRGLRIEYALDNSFNTIVPNLIGGYASNFVEPGVVGATIIGGGDTNVQNRVLADYATVLGGLGNVASGTTATAMGNGSSASGQASTAMGLTCVAFGDMSTALGDATHALGLGSLSMGYKSYAIGELTLAAGNHAFANYDGSFVWADDNISNAVFQDTSPNQFLIRASGGVGIGTQAPPPGGLNVASGGLAVSGTSSPHYSGAVGVFIENETTFGAVYGFNYTANAPLPLCLNTPGGNVGIGTTTPAYTLQVAGTCEATAFVTASDRNIKENFQPVSTQDILDKVTSLPVSRWNFKKDNSGNHIGPMAQDFYAAFSVGPDDKHIATVDEDGVALAAIQGLNQKLEADVKVKDAEIAALNSRLADLEALVKNLAAKNSIAIINH